MIYSQYKLFAVDFLLYVVCTGHKLCNFVKNQWGLTIAPFVCGIVLIFVKCQISCNFSKECCQYIWSVWWHGIPGIHVCIIDALLCILTVTKYIFAIAAQ